MKLPTRNVPAFTRFDFTSGTPNGVGLRPCCSGLPMRKPTPASFVRDSFHASAGFMTIACGVACTFSIFASAPAMVVMTSVS